MFNFIKNIFNKDDNQLPQTEEVGKIDLIILFKDGSHRVESFIGNIEYYDNNTYDVASGAYKAGEFLQSKYNFGFIFKNDNTLVPISEIQEIIIARHKYQETLK